MYRAAAIAAAFLLFLLIGPWVLLLAVAALFVPRVRRWLRPEHPWRVAGITAGALALLAGLVVVIPDGWLPIPPGPGLLVTPDYVGRAALTRPVTGVEVPQHPHLARNGTSSMHNDAWATDSYDSAGPTGDRPDVDSAWFGVEECATLAFDSHDRIVALCGDLEGPTLRILDAETDAADRDQGPARPPRRRGQAGRGRTSAAARTSTSTSTTAPSSPPPTAGSWRSPPPTPTASPTSRSTRRTTSATWCPRTTA